MFPATSSVPRLRLSAALLVVGMVLVSLGSGLLCRTALDAGAPLVAAAWLVVPFAAGTGASWAVFRILARLRDLAVAPEAAS